MTHSRSHLAVAAAGALLLISMPSHRAAAASDSAASFFGVLRQNAADAWGFLISPITGRTVEAVTPPSPVSLIHGITSKSGSHFWEHLSDAGYDLAAIDTTVGIIPDVKMTFQLVRELSEADRAALERKLEIDDMRDPGLVPSIQRQIVRTLLEASSVNNMRIGKLVIGILPLPSAEFALEPADAPLSEEHDTIYRAVTNKGKREKIRDSAVPTVAEPAAPPTSPTD
jgi:hypothetical protein